MNQAQKWTKRALICLTILGVCAILWLATFALNVLSTPVAILIWTIVFVFLLRGIVNSFEKRGINRALGTLFAYIIMLIVVGLIILFMFSPAFGFMDQVAGIIEDIPKYIAIITDWAKNLYSQYGHILKDQNVQKWINDTTAALSAAGGDIAAASANGILSVGGFFGSMFMALGIALVIAFWVLIELPAIGRETKKLIPQKFREDSKLWQVSCTHVMAGFIKGTFLQCFIIGVISGLTFWILGVPNSGALGCIVGVLNIIPIFGPILASVIALIGGLFNSLLVGLLCLGIVAAVQGLVYTFVSPKIMSSSCNIHPVLTLLCLTAGAGIGGAMSGVVGSLVGMLLAIPFVAVFKSFFVYYYEKATGICLITEDGFLFKGTPYSKEKAYPLYDALEIKPGQEHIVKDKPATDKKSNKKSGK